jgi:hypothetical protein
VPEESTGTPGTSNQNDDAVRRLERRIESLEYAAQHENKWWRGGLIAALVLVALSILIAGHHRHHRLPRGMMAGMAGMGMMGSCQGPRLMPYAPPPPPPNWGYGPGGGYYGPQQGWQPRQWNGPGPDGPPPAK